MKTEEEIRKRIDEITAQLAHTMACIACGNRYETKPQKIKRLNTEWDTLRWVLEDKDE